MNKGLLKWKHNFIATNWKVITAISARKTALNGELNLKHLPVMYAVMILIIIKKETKGWLKMTNIEKFKITIIILFLLSLIIYFIIYYFQITK